MMPLKTSIEASERGKIGWCFPCATFLASPSSPSRVNRPNLARARPPSGPPTLPHLFLRRFLIRHLSPYPLPTANPRSSATNPRRPRQISPLRASGCHGTHPFPGPGLYARQWVLGRRGRGEGRDRGGRGRGHRSRRAVLVPVDVVAGGGDVVVRAVHTAPGGQARHPRGRRHQVWRRGKTTGLLLVF
jgi:hypothetical protein